MTIRLTWKRVMSAGLLLAGAGLLFAWSGLMQVSASSGHWRVTDWFLHWAMRNSVRTYAAVQAPRDVTTDAGLVSAAGHFRQACQVCHGAPGVRPSPVMQAATPSAPDLARTADEWSDRELFWIIRHGVKFTAMPAWPAADRNDEVRRMVAFVRLLPRMTAAQYRTLTQVDEETAVADVRPGLLSTCATCHGADGRGRGQPDIPVIAGQKPGYLLAALRDYADGSRSGAVMQAAAAALTIREMKALADHYAALPGLSEKALSDRSLPGTGIASRQLPACLSCHAPGKAAPILTGQKPEYVAARLRQWQGEPTIIDARKSSATMAVIARRIPTEEIDGLSSTFRAAGDAPTAR
ncbi:MULTISPECIES: c-type cytochrome [Sphingobium]|uniref:Cytochrome C n=1 Tax=Sphingobium cupriresistens TaxID=1132417 RepID=A0A8G1ZCG3_9SPHN|nr:MULTISPECIES: c-type cytochrome [Sphingobium]MBJ7377350.1 c-type cytochrome [Sphingobium sp.]RYM06250.1 cytochrome C [Sphingobium cupriresistens]